MLLALILFEKALRSFGPEEMSDGMVGAWVDNEIPHSSLRQLGQIRSPKHGEFSHFLLVDSVDVPVPIFRGCDSDPKFMGVLHKRLTPLGHIFRQFIDRVGLDGFDLVFGWLDWLVVPLKESGANWNRWKSNSPQIL